MCVFCRTIAAGTLALVASTGVAGAADMAYPEPPVVAHEPAFANPAAGWYIRGDVGLGITENDGWELGSLTAANGRFLTDDIGDAPIIGAGVGYRVNEFVRLEITGEYRGSIGISATDQYRHTCTFVGGSCTSVGGVINRNNMWEGQLDSTVVMVGGLVDVGEFAGITPFVGGSVGAAYNRIHGLRDSDPSDLGGGGIAKDKGTWNFAWALQTGLAYDVSDRLTLEAGYRFMSLGDAESGAVSCLPTSAGCGFEGVKVKDLYSHDLRLGMRWALDAPAPAAEPDFGPIMRKF
ncbi:MAG: outer membrane beta-barrel protein [Hyphomicrobiales bacterium]